MLYMICVQNIIQPLYSVWCTLPVEVVLQYCHESGHLTEDQSAVVGGPELWQHPIKNLKLARRTVQVRSDTVEMQL